MCVMLGARLGAKVNQKDPYLWLYLRCQKTHVQTNNSLDHCGNKIVIPTQDIYTFTPYFSSFSLFLLTQGIGS